jgi:hypothetical protein
MFASLNEETTHKTLYLGGSLERHRGPVSVEGSSQPVSHHGVASSNPVGGSTRLMRCCRTASHRPCHVLPSLERSMDAATKENL